jgi:hypothetical protein
METGESIAALTMTGTFGCLGDCQMHLAFRVGRGVTTETVSGSAMAAGLFSSIRKTAGATTEAGRTAGMTDAMTAATTDTTTTITDETPFGWRAKTDATVPREFTPAAESDSFEP